MPNMIRRTSGFTTVIVATLTITVTTPQIIAARQGVRIGNLSTIPNGGMTPPTLLGYTRPTYTAEARTRRIEGVVTFQVEFDIDGNFKVLGVLKGLGYGLDETALAALKNWRFAPAYRSGQRVSVITQIDVRFDLQNSPYSLLENYTNAFHPPNVHYPPR